MSHQARAMGWAVHLGRPIPGPGDQLGVVSRTEGDDGLDICPQASPAAAADVQRVLLAAGMRNEQKFVRDMVMDRDRRLL